MEQGTSLQQAGGGSFGKALTLHPGAFILIQFLILFTKNISSTLSSSSSAWGRRKYWVLCLPAIVQFVSALGEALSDVPLGLWLQLYLWKGPNCFNQTPTTPNTKSRAVQMRSWPTQEKSLKLEECKILNTNYLSLTLFPWCFFFLLSCRRH